MLLYKTPTAKCKTMSFCNRNAFPAYCYATLEAPNGGGIGHREILARDVVAVNYFFLLFEGCCSSDRIFSP